ncbi:hypothetical protein RF11_02216 [Thelohanellus kitauei]|uniref:Uncharacterized protein n=1 Tax=Thelohanellus kitauei TaxID=669202 RepID=A0A0C2J2U8_THEKT|nr:hypothetical protein RF11_02216 [Thelohanellus kitauei]
MSSKIISAVIGKFDVDSSKGKVNAVLSTAITLFPLIIDIIYNDNLFICPSNRRKFYSLFLMSAPTVCATILTLILIVQFLKDRNQIGKPQARHCNDPKVWPSLSRNDIAALLLSHDWSIRFEAIDLMSLLVLILEIQVTKGNLKSLVKIMVDLVEQSLQKEQLEIRFVDTLMKLITITFENPSTNTNSVLATEIRNISLRVADELIVSKIKESPLLGTEMFATLIQTFIWFPLKYLSNIQRPWIVCLDVETQFILPHSILKRDLCLDEVNKVLRVFTSFNTYDLQTMERVSKTSEQILAYKILLQTVVDEYISGNSKIYVTTAEILTYFRSLFIPEIKKFKRQKRKPLFKQVLISINGLILNWLELLKLMKRGLQFYKLRPTPKDEIPESLRTAETKKKLEGRDIIFEGPFFVILDIEGQYPEITYNIAPIDEADELGVKKMQQPESSKHDTFLSGQISRNFESSFHESVCDSVITAFFERNLPVGRDRKIEKPFFDEE